MLPFDGEIKLLIIQLTLVVTALLISPIDVGGGLRTKAVTVVLSAD